VRLTGASSELVERLICELGVMRRDGFFVTPVIRGRVGGDVCVCVC